MPNKAALLQNDKVVIMYRKYVNSKFYIYAVICDISQPTITFEEKTELMETTNVFDFLSITTLLDSIVYIVYTDTQLYNIKLAVCNILDNVVE